MRSDNTDEESEIVEFRGPGMAEGKDSNRDARVVLKPDYFPTPLKGDFILIGDFASGLAITIDSE